MIAGVLGVILLVHYTTTLSKTLLFWAAFVLTRPFGATFGDWMTKPLTKGGLDLGTIGSSAVLFAMLVGLIVYTVRKKPVVPLS